MNPLEPVALRVRRRELGLTQAELADHLAVSANTVARWERGELHIGDSQRVQRLLARLEGARRVKPASNVRRRKDASVQTRVSDERRRADNNLPTELSSF